MEKLVIGACEKFGFLAQVQPVLWLGNHTTGWPAVHVQLDFCKNLENWRYHT